MSECVCARFQLLWPTAPSSLVRRNAIELHEYEYVDFVLWFEWNRFEIDDYSTWVVWYVTKSASQWRLSCHSGNSKLDLHQQYALHTHTHTIRTQIPSISSFRNDLMDFFLFLLLRRIATQENIMGNQWTGWTRLERNCHCGKAWSIDRTSGWRAVSFYVRHLKALRIPTKNGHATCIYVSVSVLFFLHLSVVCRLLSRNRTTFYLSLSNRRFKGNKKTHKEEMNFL